MVEIAHGTKKGYGQHRRAGTPPCQPCKDARAAYQKDLRERTQRGEHRPSRAKARKAAERVAKQEAAVVIDEKNWNPPAHATPEGVPPFPDWLQARGREFWVEVNEGYELNFVQRTALTNLCRLLDTEERLSAALAAKTTLWFELGETADDLADGIPVVVNGMLAERRQVHAAIRQAMNSLGLLGEVGAKAEEDPTERMMREFQEQRRAAAKAKEAHDAESNS